MYAIRAVSAFDAHVAANETMGKTSDKGGLGYVVYAVPEGQYLIGTNGRLNPNATLGNRVYNNGKLYTLTPDDWVDEAFPQCAAPGIQHEYYRW